MSQRVAAEGYADEALPEDDDEENHWALERLGQAAIALVVASFGVSLLGLATLAVDSTAVVDGLVPWGRTILAAGTLGAMASMTMATVVAAVSGTFSPF